MTYEQYLQLTDDQFWEWLERITTITIGFEENGAQEHTPERLTLTEEVQ